MGVVWVAFGYNIKGNTSAEGNPMGLLWFKGLGRTCTLAYDIIPTYPGSPTDMWAMSLLPHSRSNLVGQSPRTAAELRNGKKDCFYLVSVCFTSLLKNDQMSGGWHNIKECEGWGGETKAPPSPSELNPCLMKIQFTCSCLTLDMCWRCWPLSLDSQL